MSSGKRRTSRSSSNSEYYDRSTDIKPKRRTSKQRKLGRSSKYDTTTEDEYTDEELFKYPKTNKEKQSLPQNNTKKHRFIAYGDLDIDETVQYALTSINTDEDYDDSTSSSDSSDNHEQDRQYIRKNLTQMKRQVDNAIQQQDKFLANENSFQINNTNRSSSRRIENGNAEHENQVIYFNETKKLEQELHKTQQELEWLKNTIINKQSVNNNVEKLNQINTEHQINEFKQQQIQFQETIKKLQNQIEHLNSQMNSEKSTHFEKIESLKIELKTKDEEIIRLRESNKQITNELQELRDRESHHVQLAQELAEQAKDTLHHNKKQSEQLIAMRQKLNEKSIEIKQCEKLVKEIKAHEQELKKEKLDVEKSYQNLQKRHSELFNQCKELKQCAKSMEDELEISHKEQEKRTSTWTSQKNELKRVNEQEHQRISELESSLYKERENSIKLAEESNTLRREIIELKQNCKEFQNDVDRLKKEHDIRLSTADEIFNNKVRDVLDRELKLKESMRDVQRHLEESEQKRHELQYQLDEAISANKKDDSSVKWREERVSLQSALDHERENRSRIENKNIKLEKKISSYKDLIEKLQKQQSEQKQHNTDELSAMNQRQADLETRCKKLSRILKKLYQRYTNLESHDADIRRLSTVDRNVIHNEHHYFDPIEERDLINMTDRTVPFDEMEVKRLSRQCDDEMRQYREKLSSLLTDIGEHGKELGELKHTFHNIKDRYAQEIDNDEKIKDEDMKPARPTQVKLVPKVVGKITRKIVKT